VIFIGAAGALKADIKLGDIIMPKYSIAGDGGSLYLYEKIAVENFRKKIYPDKEISQRVIETAEDRARYHDARNKFIPELVLGLT
jgi:purine-nucleoside phosphorylase